MIIVVGIICLIVGAWIGAIAIGLLASSKRREKKTIEMEIQCPRCGTQYIIYKNNCPICGLLPEGE